MPNARRVLTNKMARPVQLAYPNTKTLMVSKIRGVWPPTKTIESTCGGASMDHMCVLRVKTASDRVVTAAAVSLVALAVSLNKLASLLCSNGRQLDRA